MKLHRTSALAVLLLCGALLSACGGGGGGSSGSADGVPASGDWAWVLKASGPTATPTYGLSLVSPSAPATEYRVEYGSSVLTDARVVSSGNVDVAGRKTATLHPYALVYIVGGDVRRVPLQADGRLPSTLVQRAQSTTACAFLKDAAGRSVGEAIDYATPENSRLLVSTAGADGQCGTSDDGTAQVQLSATNGVAVTKFSGAVPLGYFRSATTLAPAGWILTRTVQLWASGTGTDTSVTVRAGTDPAFTSVVQAAPTAALMDDGAKLSVLDLSTPGAPVETKLDAGITSGGGWTGIGYDADAFYAYRNSGDSSGAWTVLKVTRGATPAATVLRTGAGQVSVASMGTSLMYLTVFGSSGNSLMSISKSIGTPAVTLESTAATTLTTVQTSASGVHELWRVVNVGSTALNYQVEFIDEAGTLLYSTNAGGYPMVAPDPQVQHFDTSESRTRFVFATGYGTRAFGDAQISGYDASTKTLVNYGTLPGATAYGTATVYSSAIGGPGSSMAGFATTTADGVIAATGAQVFSFDFGTANSLKFTSATR